MRCQRKNWLLSRLRGEQELDIAVAALNRRGDDAENAAAERSHKAGDLIAHRLADGLVAYHALLERTASRLELRLDQPNERRRLRQERQRRRQHQFERDEADIDDGEIGLFVEAGGGEGADVGLFPRYNVVSRAQAPMQLPAPDIDRIDALCAALQ